MELLDYLRVVRERWLLVVLALLVGVGGAVAVTSLTTPRWSATSQVYVSVLTSDSSTASLAQGSSFSQGQVTAFADLATSPLVLDPAIDALGLGVTAAELAPDVAATTTRDTPLIEVTVTRGDAVQAAAISSAVVESMASVVPELQRPSLDQPSPVKLTITRYAEVPSAPSAPDGALNVAIGGVVDLLAGVALALLVSAADTRIRSAEALAQISDLALMGQVTYEKDVAAQPLALVSDPRGRVAEAVRQVRTNLQFAAADERARVLVVTSAVPGEGKSTTAANLALALAEAGERVLLVDGDLRRPSVARITGLEQGAGLTTVLVGRATVEDVVQRPLGTTLDVLTSGSLPPNPSELLGSGAMGTLLEQVRDRYDTVVVDSAPLLPVADGVVLSRAADGVLVVVGSRVVRKAQTRHALETLALVEARVLGLVLNGIAASKAPSYEYYYVEAPVTRPRWSARHARTERARA